MLDLTKPVQRRDGGPARIIFTEAKGDRPVIALHEFLGFENTLKHYVDGRVYKHETAMDLVPKKVKKWRWAVARPYHVFTSHGTEEEVRRLYKPEEIIGRILESEIEE
jgi:hypothetical protein